MVLGVAHCTLPATSVCKGWEAQPGGLHRARPTSSAKQGRDDLEVFCQTNKLLGSYVEKRAKSSRPLLGAVLSLWPGPQVPQCISRESSPGHIDGNDVFYH